VRRTPRHVCQRAQISTTTTRDGKPSPRGVTSPKPVTTTLRIAYLMDGDALVRKVAEEEVRAVLATVAVQIV
jgi:hypothetical protein